MADAPGGAPGLVIATAAEPVAIAAAAPDATASTAPEPDSSPTVAVPTQCRYHSADKGQ